MKILIVEDDAAYREMLINRIEKWKHVFVSATTGAEALEKAGREIFDLFLLDVFLPDMTAMDLIPQIKALAPQTHIITMTGYSNRNLERELRELGISYYTAKPLAKRELKSILDHMSMRRDSESVIGQGQQFVNPI